MIVICPDCREVRQKTKRIIDQPVARLQVHETPLRQTINNNHAFSRRHRRLVSLSNHSRDPSSPSSNRDIDSFPPSPSRGLGYAFIQYYAAQPDTTVIGIVRNAPAVEARLAKDNITNVHVLAADITDASAIQAAADATAQITGGGLDILINNAGLSGDSADSFVPVTGLTAAQIKENFTASFDANVIGVAITTNAFLPLIRKGKGKKIITLSTGMADAELVNRFNVAISGAYAISKAAVNMLVSKYHAALGASEGILNLAISPGFVDTNEGKPMDEERLKGVQGMVQMFSQYAPHFTGPITPEESVRLVVGVFERATVEKDGGGFVSQFGDKQWL